MNEELWLHTNELGLMLDYVLMEPLGHRVRRPPFISERKFRLFLCACCRHAPAYLTDPDRWRAVEVAEKYADGEVDQPSLQKAYGMALNVNSSHWMPIIAARSRLTGTTSEEVMTTVENEIVQHDGLDPVTNLFRDIVGNIFRPVSWRMPPHAAVRSDAWGYAYGMASRIYQEHDFAALPVLADALEDAGCTVPELLAHLRSPGPHVHGCWAVDVLLGRD